MVPNRPACPQHLLEQSPLLVTKVIVDLYVYFETPHSGIFWVALVASKLDGNLTRFHLNRAYRSVGYTWTPTQPVSIAY